MDNKRLDYIDMVKGIGMFFVVLGHMQDITTITRVWISSFHMPLFFIVSGILMAIKNEEKKDIKETIKKKWRGIMIPYMWFSLIYFLIDILNVLIIKNIDVRTFVVDTISSVTFYGMSVLWFLPALFLGSIGFLFLCKKIPARVNYFLLVVIALVAYQAKRIIEAKIYNAHANDLLIVSLIHIVYIFLRAAIAMSFIGYAYYFQLFIDASSEKLRFLNNKIICVALGIVMVIVNYILAMINECVDLNNIILNNVALYYLAAFVGVYGIILICKGLPAIPVITYFGKNSIIVMACHVNFYILYMGLKMAWFVDKFVTKAKHYVFVSITVIMVFFLSAFVIEIINRFLPFILGRPMKNKQIQK